MGRKALSLLATSLLFSCLVLAQAKLSRLEAANDFPVHNLSSGFDYPSIQEAIDAPPTLDGHTILVDPGIYAECISVSKSLKLNGASMNTTTIYGSGQSKVVEVRARGVILSNFTITNSSGYGITLQADLTNPGDSVIQHNIITDTLGGIKLWGWPGPSNITVAHNIIVNNTCGIILNSGENNTISANTVVRNERGILISGKDNNVSLNLIESNFIGLEVGGSNNKLRNNEMNSNQFNFLPSFDWLGLPHMAEHDIDTSNEVDGRSIYYLINQTGLTLDSSTDPEIGFLGLKNCKNVTARDLCLANNGFGALLVDSQNCTLKNCTFSNNVMGVSLDTNNNSLGNCTVSGNYHGVSMTGDANTVAKNTIVNNTVRHAPYTWPSRWPQGLDLEPLRSLLNMLTMYSGGLWLFQATNCTITENTVEANENGIVLYRCSLNTFRDNTMANNLCNFGFDPSENFIPPEWSYNPPNSPQISPYLLNDIDASNVINGKPIYYWISRHDEAVPSDAGYVALVNCSDVVLENLVLKDNWQGALLVFVNNTIVRNNTVSKTRYAVDIRDQLFRSYNNTVAANNLTENGTGVICWHTANCTVVDNVLTSNLFGILAASNTTLAENEIADHRQPLRDDWILGLCPPYFNYEWWRAWNTQEAVPDGVGGIFLVGQHTLVSGNNFRNNSIGLILGSFEMRARGSENAIRGNSFEENTNGILLLSPNNTIFHNNFINNSHHVYINPNLYGKVPWEFFFNEWDNGAEGNFWDDYTGVDSDQDAIGDTKHYANVGDNIDEYPLMGRFSSFQPTSQHSVQTICNSTISDFAFSGDRISFNVTGSDGTLGFCRICIPAALLNGTYEVFVNQTRIPHTLLGISNSSHSYLYFSFSHSTQDVYIVSEAQPLILLLLASAMSMAIAWYKSKQRHMRARQSQRAARQECHADATDHPRELIMACARARKCLRSS
jgi:parallel beta-helix repeat protein